MAPFRKSLSALLVGFSLSPAAWPLGFGELHLQSQLNQPLQAEIPILGVPAYASDSVRIRLGRREDFSSLGYDYSSELDDIRTELVQRDNRLVLQLRSGKALREPLLNLVLVAEEGNTRYLRDYALLLDLPGTAQLAATPVVAPSVTPSVTPAESPAAPTPAVVTSVSATPAPASVAPAPLSRADRVASAEPGASALETRYGPTQPGESLSTIAHRLGKARGDVWQAFGVALYRANPQAFIAGDPNRLKAAVALQLPTADQVARYRVQDWQALFAAPSAGSAPTAVVADVVTSTPISNVPSAPTKSAADVGSERVPAETVRALQQQNADLKAELQAASDRMQALEAQLAALDRRYVELTSRPASPPVEPVADAIPSTNVVPAQPSSEPVTVAIRDTLAGSAPTDAGTATAIETARPDAGGAAADGVSGSENNTSNVTTPRKDSGWQTILWPLATVVILVLSGVLFWQWRERRQQRKALTPRTKAPRVPRPILPAAELEESAAPVVDVGSPDRRMLKLKQVQSALETYLTYQRFDRALELLEHEMHIAGDDLLLRRQLQRMQKEVRKAQTEWQENHKAQMSELFDQATTSQVDKPAARDDSKKTSG